MPTASGSKGVEVVYLRDLVAESITDADVRADLIRQFLEESGVRTTGSGRAWRTSSLPCRTRRWCLP